MTEPAALVTVLGLNLYPYGLCVALAAALGCLLFLLLWKRRGGKTADGLLFALIVIPCCVVMARVGYCAVRAGFLQVDYVPAFPLHLEWGGFSLAGGCVGLLIALWIFKRATHVPFAEVSDRAVPAALCALVGLRLAERFTTAGVGGYMDNAALQWFPMVVQDTYGDYVMPVFFWEALAAMAIVLWLLTHLRKTARGDTTLWGMLLFGLTQILLESLREDDFLRFGFVRVNQLLSIVLVMTALGIWLWRGKPSRKRIVAVCACAAVCTGALIWVEFALDKSSVPDGVLYGVMCLVLAALGAVGLKLWKQGNRKMEGTHAQG